MKTLNNYITRAEFYASNGMRVEWSKTKKTGWLVSIFHEGLPMDNFHFHTISHLPSVENANFFVKKYISREPIL